MENFREWAVKAAEWGADYRARLRDLPVRPDIKAGDIAAQLPAAAPEEAEPFDRVFADFERIIAPGMTHWQHPRFFAYFPGSAAPASVVAEHLVNAIAAQCMLWQTSPAATELETVVCDWMRGALGLPNHFTGAIHDTASIATLCAVLMMRERALNGSGKTQGLSGAPRLRIYTSQEKHSSIDRAIWFSGIGDENLVRLPIKGPRRGADPEALDALIRADIAAGMRPAGVIANVGATSVGAVDPVAALAKVARAHGLFLHVDAAWAGVAMICPELRDLWAGVEEADSVVLNPHKWMGVQFDCSLCYVRDAEAWKQTLAAKPDYLHTPGHDAPVNYSEWTIPLGRRFRALKLWFVLRAYGLEGLRTMIRNHIRWSRALCEKLRAAPGFEIVTEPSLSLFSFRYHGAPASSRQDARGSCVDALNKRLLETINADGRIYLTQTSVDERFAIRFQAGQFECTEADVMSAFDVITEIAAGL